MSVHRELWSRARPLFEELVELDSAQRKSRVDEIGRSAPELRETLESLLLADASDDDPLRGYSFAPLRRGLTDIEPVTRDPLGIIGNTVSHFRVTGYLAAGGMGVVYTGEDLQLARTVALKFPAPHQHITKDLKERFVREARTAAALDHPNLCSVYEIAESEYGLFLAMPLYPGETLKECLAREHTLSAADAIALIRQVTTGLASAHAAGIVHRDLKPGNIMLLPDGLVKILDFGLAKVRDTTQTKSRATLGTVAYMAPEQIRSERVDARSDLWAVGVIMYEMLTGVQRFASDHELAILHGIVHVEPKRVSQLNRNTPPPLEQIVAALLQKDRSHRYQCAESLLADLDALDRGVPLAHRIPLWTRAWQRRQIRISVLAGSALLMLLAFGSLSWRLGQSNQVSGTAAPAALQTLAVLPFVNRQPSSTNQYLVSGFTDGIVSQLSRTQGLRVAGLSSSGALQRQGLAPRAVGVRLGAAHVIEGTMRVTGDTLQAYVQLTRVSDADILWSQKFRAPMSDILSLQAQVADSILRQLEPGSARSVALMHPPTNDPEAYALYLKGRYAWEQRTREKFEEALALYNGAVERDPEFALAYAVMAEAYVNMQNFRLMPSSEALAKADLASAKAIAIDTTLAEAYAARGQLLSTLGSYAEAEAALKRAIDLNPSAPWAHHYYALLLTMLGRFDEAKAELRRTLSIDPLSVPRSSTLAILLAYDGRVDKTRAQFDQPLRQSRHYVVTLYYSASFEASQSNYRKAGELLERALAIAPNFSGVRGALAYTYGKLGRTAEARRLIADERSRVFDERSPVNYALTLALVGKSDSAFAMLRTAQWDIPTLIDLRVDPLLKRLRSDPRYPE